MKSEFIIDVYDFPNHKWVNLMKYSERKVALWKYNQVKQCFPHCRYRLYEQIMIKGV